MRVRAIVLSLSFVVGCSVDRGGTGVIESDTGVPIEDTNVAVESSSPDSAIDPTDLGVDETTQISDATEEAVADVSDATVASDASDAVADIGISCVHFAYTGHDYWFCNKSGDWGTARAACIILGTDLAVIGDDAENGFVHTSALSLTKSDVLIGHTDSKDEGQWLGVDGKAKYTHWDDWQPDNWFGEDCAVMRDNGKWNDVDCGDDFDWFVCESK